MAFLAKTLYDGDGVNSGPFTIGFPYISQAHVEVRVDGGLQVLDTDYEFTTSSNITFLIAPPPTGTDNIEFLRETPTTRLIDWQDGGAITEAKLDKDSNQLAFSNEETIDVLTQINEDGLAV